MEIHDLKNKIRDIPDFPKKGVVFRDITPLLKDGEAFKTVIKELAAYYQDKKIDLIVSSEARGFIVGGALSYELGVGFIPVRKPGKLPAEKINHSFEKEYGPDTLEIHVDAIVKGQKVLICDDVLATGGTIQATAELVKKLEGDIIGFCFLVELNYLNGRKLLEGYDIFSLIKYDE